MIIVEEKETLKVPGLTSLHIPFPDKKELCYAIEKLSCYYKHNKLKIYEVPITGLKKLITTITTYDDIELRLLKDKQEEPIEYEIANYPSRPYKHQLEAIQYGLNHNKWLLLDDTGLGKTLELIYLALELKRTRGIKHCLIICGINNLKFNWMKEIQKHAELNARILGQRITRNGTLKIGPVKDRVEQLLNPISEFFIITNIETLRDERVSAALAKNINQIDMIALDEAHCIKTQNTNQSKQFLELDATYKVAMTGTLLLNNPLDTYVALKWIGAEKSTYTMFKEHYCIFASRKPEIIIGFKNLELLKYQLSKYSLRRKKEEVLDLPPKNIILEYIEMNEKQSKFYNELVNGIRDEIDKVTLVTTSLQAMATRLRQATALPSILTSSDIKSSKIERACELVDEIVSQGKKVVIFSTYKEPVYELEQLLKEYNPVIATGDIKDEVVSHNQDLFQESPEHKVFIGTWQKCGTGITLTAASYMIFIDTPYTQGAFQQCCDRIYRIGTNESVFIYVLINNDTFDEHVQSIVDKKKLLSDYVIDDKIPEDCLDELKKYIKGIK